MSALNKARALEARARNARPALSASQAPRIQAPRLPCWPDSFRAVPNVALRSALFAVIGKGKRAWFESEVVYSQAGIGISFTGTQLDQGDLDLWVTLLHVLRNHPLDQEYQTSIYHLLQVQGITDTGPNRDTLRNRLERLSTCVLLLRTGSYSYQGGLINANRPDRADPLILRLNTGINSLFASDQFTQVHLGVRRALNGHALAQWLHGYYASHAAPYPVRIETLRKLSGSRTVNLGKFLQLLRNALDTLSRASTNHGQSFAYQIEGDLVRVEKNPSSAQHRHLAKRQNDTVTTGRHYRHSE